MSTDDLRTKKLAKLVVDYCLKVKPNQDIVISGSSEAEEFVEALYKEIIFAKANPVTIMHPRDLDYFFFKNANLKQLKHFPHYWYEAVKKANGHIGIETEYNTRELSSCDPKKIAIRTKTIAPIEKHIYEKRGNLKYVEVAYPCLTHAIEADMALDEWKDFVFSACLIDWKEMKRKYSRIANNFDRGEEVHLIGENVDLKFSIKDKNALYDDGTENMPGGEIFMAPVKKTLNGWIKFEYPAVYNGKEIRDIALKFKQGKVIEAKASKNKKALIGAIKSDTNASYIGELGIGVNPHIDRFTKNLLFDEKITGTIHLALGMAYLENGGGNDSAIHWDIVKDMSKAKILLDGKAVQENGKWKI